MSRSPIKESSHDNLLLDKCDKQDIYLEVLDNISTKNAKSKFNN